MANYNSNVEDPEKHFLGNLLEDDSFGSTSANARSSGHLPEAANVSSTPIPPAPIISAGAPNTFWPEPPPPYTPTAAKPWYTGQPGANPLAELLQAGLKNCTCELNDVLSMDSDFYTALSRQSVPSAGPTTLIAQPQIHHHHHNLHHHTHTHNIVENHHHYITTTPGLKTPNLSVDTNATSRSLSQQSASPALSSRLPSSLSPFSSIGVIVDASSTSLPPHNHQQHHHQQQQQQKYFAQSSSMTTVSHSPQHPHAEWSQHEHDDLLAYTMMSTSSASASSSPPLLSTTAPASDDFVRRSYVNAANSANSSSKLVTGQAHPKGGKKAAANGVNTAIRTVAVGAELQNLKQRLSTAAIPSASRIIVKGQPHSAPVVSKMPFSYRDVAAREQLQNVSANESSPPQAVQSKRSSVTSATDGAAIVAANGGVSGEDRKTAAGVSLAATPDSADLVDKRLNKDRKSRSDNEFQKITRKTRVAPNNKEKVLLTDATSLPVLENPVAVDASTRYDVLQNLSNANPQGAVQKPANAKSNRALVIAQVRSSRSSSRGEDDEDEDEEEDDDDELGDAQHIVHAAGTRLGSKRETNNKPKKAPVQRRRAKRRAEPHWTDPLISIGLILVGYLQLGIQWMFQLIVDFCVKVGDIVGLYMEAIYDGTLCVFKKIFFGIFSIFWKIMVYYRDAVLWVFFYDPEEPLITQWGARRETQLPNTAVEIMERLLRESATDAYAVLGLRPDCSDADIKKLYGRMNALLGSEKCTADGAEVAFDLLQNAYATISTPQARATYLQETAHKNPQHKKLTKAWEDLREHIEELRATMFCDCGRRHRRLVTEIRVNEARYCRRCDTRHPAKQNDIWVERRFWGLKSVYMTCSENTVFDITEWAQCERNVLKNMRPNTHTVQYRLVTPSANVAGDGGDHVAGGGGAGGGSSSHANSAGLNADRLAELREEFNLAVFRSQQPRGFAQISFRPSEPRDEDRSRRAANRRQKKWRA